MTISDKKAELCIKAYIELHGIPRCKGCGKDIKLTSLRNGQPKKYCSRSCLGKHSGINNIKSPEELKKIFQEKYGVNSAVELKHVREAALKGRKEKKHTEETKKKLSEAQKRNWSSEEYRNKILTQFIKFVKSPEESVRRSKRQKEIIASNPHNLLTGGKLSKLHLQIRDKLNLLDKGYKSEQYIDGYFVDELNESTKTIIEVNGDYVHANPKLYKQDDVIKLIGNVYTAKEKWEKDTKKIEFLRKRGYNVIVIWETAFKAGNLPDIS
jgi:very-short-patch-repair endonuclease